ncbi:MAG: hypothetical protein Q4D29_02810 [Lachnospiraceae bacterium]|nr:hypothetical protein [Lachnospiraceae bacterium]
MIITNSSIGMDSARTYTSVSMEAYTYERSVKTMSAKEFTDALNNAYQDVHKDRTSNDEKSQKEKLANEDNADTSLGNGENSLAFLKGKFSEISTAKVAKVSKHEEDLKSAIRYLVLNFLLMLLFGKNGGESEDLFERAFSGADMSGDDLAASGISFTEVSDRMKAEHYEGEFEYTTFNARGIVKTSDGREIDFGIDIGMSRSFEKYTCETGVRDSLQMRLCDPLVINLDNCGADISDQKFYFDLDSDGEMDNISMLGKGSGFLALDLNDDGVINDGSELFGTKSGDGFKDLAKYDKDGNGWIDEADEVFDKLSIMCFNEDGTTSLYKLKDKDVGAIYLGNKETEFSVNNQENITNAKVRKTGIFLYESGAVGSVQHVDLAINKGA